MNDTPAGQRSLSQALCLSIGAAGQNQNTPGPPSKKERRRLSHAAAGRYRLSMRERETTVTELMAMARPAHSGFRVMPKKG